MRAFAELLDRLSLTASRNAKLVLVRDYLRSTPDPDRGWALAALTGDLTFDAAKPAMIRRAVEARIDPVLFGWSYDYVGDLAETVALIWPPNPDHRANREPELGEVVETLRTAGRGEVADIVVGPAEQHRIDPRLDGLADHGRLGGVEGQVAGERGQRPPPVRIGGAANGGLMVHAATQFMPGAPCRKPFE